MLTLTLQTQTSPPTILGYVDICNDGSGTEVLGNYRCRLSNHHRQLLDEARVKDYPRNLGAWMLVRRALEALEVP